MMNRYVFVFCFLALTKLTQAQCEVRSTIWPDQTMYYSVAPELFFYTEAKSLKGNITTDKHNYFLRLLPKPFPLKEEGKELKHQIEIVLTNDTIILLDHFDFQYRSKDTSLSMMYEIPKKLIPTFSKHDVKSLRIDLGDENGPRNYVFVLHKATLREQLNCLLELK